MKKSKIWIHVCVHLLLFITLGVHSSALDVNLVANAISRLNVLRQNIPKDYRIPIDYMPKEKAGMCWVTLNVFYLENSLDKLENKFGNISSNKDDIRILIEILQALRIKMYSLEQIMGEYVCHYQNNAWKTEQYFDFVKDFLLAANTEETLDDCDPPPCPSTPAVTTIEPTTSISTSTPNCQKGCSPRPERLLPEIVERSLLSLLFIPLLALVILLVWRIRSRRNKDDVQQNPGEDALFTGTEGTAPPLNAEIPEKNKLNVIETV